MSRSAEDLRNLRAERRKQGLCGYMHTCPLARIPGGTACEEHTKKRLENYARAHGLSTPSLIEIRRQINDQRKKGENEREENLAIERGHVRCETHGGKLKKSTGCHDCLVAERATRVEVTTIYEFAGARLGEWPC